MLGLGTGGGTGVVHETSSMRHRAPPTNDPRHLSYHRSPASIGRALLLFHFNQELRSPDSDNCDRGLDADSIMRKLGDVPRDKSHDAACHLDDQSQTALRWRKSKPVDQNLAFRAERQPRVVAQHYTNPT